MFVNWRDRMFDSKANVRKEKRFVAFCTECSWTGYPFSEPEVSEYDFYEHMKRHHNK